MSHVGYVTFYGRVMGLKSTPNEGFCQKSNEKKPAERNILFIFPFWPRISTRALYLCKFKHNQQFIAYVPFIGTLTIVANKLEQSILKSFNFFEPTKLLIVTTQSL